MIRYIAVILLLIPVTVQSQVNKKLSMDHEKFFRFGAKGGVNINKISGKSYESGFNYNFQAGVFLQFNISNRFGIQPEVNFVQSKSAFTKDATEIYDDLFLDGSQKKATMNYLEIPVLLNVNIGPSKRVKLQAGPSYGGLLKQTIDSLKTNTDFYKHSEWSLIGGLWIQAPFINLGARYKLGLTNINGIDDKQTWKSQAIQIFVGITI